MAVDTVTTTADPAIAAWIAVAGSGAGVKSSSMIATGLLIAFVAFFRLVREIGSARATLVTYMNMAVAVILGIILLAEPITTGILIGMPLVVVGSVLATRKHVKK